MLVWFRIIDTGTTIPLGHWIISIDKLFSFGKRLRGWRWRTLLSASFVPGSLHSIEQSTECLAEDIQETTTKDIRKFVSVYSTEIQQNRQWPSWFPVLVFQPKEELPRSVEPNR